MTPSIPRDDLLQSSPIRRSALVIGIAFILLLCGNLTVAQDHAALDHPRSQTTHQLQFLETEIQRTSGEIDQLRQEVAAVRRDVDDLIAQLESLSAEPDVQPAPSAKPGPREVKFRLPLAHISQRSRTELFVCEQNRVQWINVRALSEVVDSDELRLAVERVKESGDTESGHWSAVRGGFDYRWEVKKQDDSVLHAVWIVRKADEQGETIEEAIATDSEFSRKLATFNPNTTRVELAVRSDSFDTYRAIRSRLFEQGFDVNWKPLNHDQRIQLGIGAGIDN